VFVFDVGSTKHLLFSNWCLFTIFLESKSEKVFALIRLFETIGFKYASCGIAGTEPFWILYIKMSRLSFLLSFNEGSSRLLSISVTQPCSRDLYMGHMKLAAFRWMLSSVYTSFSRKGSHTVAPYSKVVLTSEMYAVFLTHFGHLLRFLCTKPKVELAFFLIWSMSQMVIWLDVCERGKCFKKHF